MVKQTEDKASLGKVLTDRGVHLEHIHNSRQCSSMYYGQNAVVGQDAEGDDIVVAIGSRCPKCHMRVRGFNHAEGHHHLGTVPRVSR